jgi:hypothetical protein
VTALTTKWILNLALLKHEESPLRRQSHLPKNFVAVCPAFPAQGRGSLRRALTTKWRLLHLALLKHEVLEYQQAAGRGSLRRALTTKWILNLALLKHEVLESQQAAGRGSLRRALTTKWILNLALLKHEVQESQQAAVEQE